MEGKRGLNGQVLRVLDTPTALHLVVPAPSACPLVVMRVTATGRSAGQVMCVLGFYYIGLPIMECLNICRGLHMAAGDRCVAWLICGEPGVGDAKEAVLMPQRLPVGESSKGREPPTNSPRKRRASHARTDRLLSCQLS